MAGQDITKAAAITPKVFFSGQLGDVNEDTLYTVPAASSAIIRQGTICNVTGATVSVSLNVMRSGQATGTLTHRVISAYPLAAGDTLSLADYVKGLTLGAGDFLTAQASSSAAIVIVLSGVENT
jgi:hypothetical protein